MEHLEKRNKRKNLLEAAGKLASSVMKVIAAPISGLNLAGKVTAGVAFILFFCLTIGLLEMVGMNKVSRTVNILGNQRMRATEYIMTMLEQQSIIRGCDYALGHRRLSEDYELRKGYYDQIETANGVIDAASQSYKQLNHTKEEEGLIKDFEPLYRRWLDDNARVVELSKQKDSLVAAGVSRDDKRVANLDALTLKAVLACESSFNDAHDMLNQLVNLNIKNGDADVKNANMTASSTNAFLYIMIAAGLLISVAVVVGLNFVISSILKNMMSAAKSVTDAAAEGRLEERADLGSIDREFRPVIDGLNRAMDAVIIPLKASAVYVDRISRGDIPEKITADYKGEFTEIKDNLNKCIDAINLLLKDTGMLSAAAQDGRLSVRADASAHSGDFRRVVEGVNRTLDLVVTPINEAADVLEEMAAGNLAVMVKGVYKGGHAKIKECLNKTIISMNEILANVNHSIIKVNSGALQVDTSSKSLAESSSEAASSLEEIASSMHELNAQTGHNAENAGVANNLASQARNYAEEGASQMKGLDSAMKQISESSRNVAKIMKVIDEIAFQTNLLALNAAVEAARAGKHGKGFSVVAEEVRNLAKRSADAARETAELIEGSVKKADAGVAISQETERSLKAIVQGTNKVTDLIGEIAASSKEQTLGIAQITKGITQLEQLTQSNSSGAEESAAASEELTRQAGQLGEMMNKFSLSENVHAVGQMEGPRTGAVLKNA
jgi:methyl-accepting chemotaxis protein